MPAKVIPLPMVRRLPTYLRLLRRLKAAGQTAISGTVLAEELHLEPILVRKDLALTGVVGRPRVGFDVGETIRAIEALLNWNNTSEAVVVGAGRLGGALLGYDGFAHYGLTLVAGFDADPAKADTEIHGKPILPMDRLVHVVGRLRVKMAILTVPAEAAQSTADLLVEAGIEAIWNYTPVKLRVPSHVVVQREDLAAGLAVLSVMLAESQRGVPREDDEEAR